MHLIEMLSLGYGTFLLSEPFGSNKDMDEREDFTGLQYVLQNNSSHFVTTCRQLQSHALFLMLPVCCSELLEDSSLANSSTITKVFTIRYMHVCHE